MKNAQIQSFLFECVFRITNDTIKQVIRNIEKN